MLFVQLFKDAGFAGMAIVALVGLSGPVLLAVALLGLFRIRVPAPIPLLAPISVLLAGQVGVLMGTLAVREAVRFADPAAKSSILAAGISEAMSSRLLAGGAASALFFVVAALAAVSNLRAGEKAVWTPLHAGAPLALSVLAAGISVVGALQTVVGWFVVATCLAGGVLLAITSLRTDEDDAHAARLASARGLVATALVCAAATLFSTAITWGRMEAFRAIAVADPSMKMALLQDALAWAPWALLAGPLGLALAGAAAVFPVAHRLDPRALIGAGISAVLLLLPGLARLLVEVWGGSVFAQLLPGA